MLDHVQRSATLVDVHPLEWNAGGTTSMAMFTASDMVGPRLLSALPVAFGP